MRSGRLRNSTTSSKSALASSTPATSSKVTPVLGSIWNLALDLPKAIGLPGPPIPPGPPGPPWPPPLRRESRKSPPTRRRGKARFPRRLSATEPPSSEAECAAKSTFCCLKRARSSREVHAHALHAVAQLGAHGLHDGDGAPLIEVHLLDAPHVEVLEEAAVAHPRRGHIRARQVQGQARGRQRAPEPPEHRPPAPGGRGPRARAP